MKTITVQWKVSNKQHKHLMKYAKSWGHKRIAAYIKAVIAAKVGNIEA